MANTEKDTRAGDERNDIFITLNTLYGGLELVIDKAALNDMELLDDLVAVDRKDALAISRIYDRVLTRDQKKRLYDNLRDPESGRVTVESAFMALREIFDKIGEAGKN